MRRKIIFENVISLENVYLQAASVSLPRAQSNVWEKLFWEDVANMNSSCLTENQFLVAFLSYHNFLLITVSDLLSNAKS